jgi:hypothetical protein
MKLDAIKLGKSCAAAFAIIWVICSVFVMVMPMGMMHMTGYMMHSDAANINAGMGWSMGLGGLIIGLIAWSLVAGFSGWLIAVLYNKQLEE